MRFPKATECTPELLRELLDLFPKAAYYGCDGKEEIKIMFNETRYPSLSNNGRDSFLRIDPCPVQPDGVVFINAVKEVVFFSLHPSSISEFIDENSGEDQYEELSPREFLSYIKLSLL
jgi:hypothetical protein